MPRSSSLRVVAPGRARCAWGAACAALIAIGCGERGAAPASSPTPASKTAPAPREPLIVLAASSLRPAFDELARRLQASEPGAQVRVSYAGSQELSAQIRHGAPAGVIAFADEQDFQPLLAEGLCETPQPLADNELALAVPKGSALRAFAELANAKRIVLAGPTVPLGRYTAALLERAAAGSLGPGFATRVRSAVVSEEPSAARVLTRVQLGEADAAIVYRTDLIAGGDGIELVAVPDELQARTHYAIAEARRAGDRTLARAFVALARSPEGQAVLEAHGFLRPVPGSAGAAP